ncbi:MAG: DUF4301 family protein [Muribaculaceae bacterium]|nr:DUF4301 family protein [Muribaculaceae bacterium]
MNLTEKDLVTLSKKGISEEKFDEQLKMLKDGFPFLKIEAAVTPGHGLTVPTPELIKQSEDMWKKYLAGGAKVMKMVPASGAASRMFKDLFAFLNGKSNKPDNDFMKKFFEHIENLAFFTKLNLLCLQLFGYSVASLVKMGRYKDVIDILLNKVGLNYGKLPKALLEFHKEMGGSRTPLQEHLAEGAQYAAGKDGKVHLHFTVSEEHVPLVEAKLEEIKSVMEHNYGVEYDITLSVQKPSTDTVASKMDGTPYYENEELFFRPGGHGALIENLNDLDADVIFIKNIANLVPDTLRQPPITYKMVLGGILVGIKRKIDQYCERLAKGVPSGEEMVEMLDFLRHKLCVTHDKASEMTPEQLRDYLFSKFNRPTRVCGMVKNEGEPGGGPFLVYNPDGTVSPQILESSQINPNDKEAQKLLKEATHFNPVDLVVCTKDYKGQKFYLPDYVDKATGFISIKSREGVEIKALELPGLWNGAMSDWNTLMVEVPVETFNPVKTVNDLLRPTHQPS